MSNIEMIQDQFFSELLSIDPKYTAFLINGCASAQNEKHEILFKLWTILNIDRTGMRNELLLCGIDAGYINKEEAGKGTVHLDECDLPSQRFLCRDDVDRLTKELQVNKSNLNEMLDESAFFGSIK